jgi:hypothetical protein
MGTLFVIICQCLAQVEISFICVKNERKEISNITYLYMEIINPGCIDFVSFDNHLSIMSKKCRIIICKHLLEILEINGSI